MPINQILISSRVSALPVSSAVLKRFISYVLKKLKYRHTMVSVVFVSDQTIKKLNQKHLHHAYATDVLAFPFASGIKKGKQPHFLGEVIVSAERAKSQAKEFSASYREELLRYVAHGILHLSGFRDKTRPDQIKMRKKENELLDTF